MPFSGKTAVVTGGSRGLGRGIVEALREQRARVIAIARGKDALSDLASSVGAETVVGDAADEELAERMLRDEKPDLVVLCAGASPPLGAIHTQTWDTFNRNWQVDAQSTFHWLRRALKLPMKPGSHVVVVSSGAAIKGSPASGGYAPAKRAQWFIAEYAATEAQRLALSLRIHVILPQLNPSTELGRAGIAAYAERAGVTPEEYARRFDPPVTPEVMGRSVVELYREPERFEQLAYVVKGTGLAPL